MHRVETDPEYEPIKNHLEELSSIPKIGNGCFQRLLFVLSYDKSSSNVSEVKIAERRSKLSKQVDAWKRSRGPACTMSTVVLPELFQGDPEIAWRAVGELFRI
ncbi:hypothetical protein JVU11DRAFT_7614 [Chiua virens]|nr:hypothetical protein JVU11DRAFT_7614 [Chiua virens]